MRTVLFVLAPARNARRAAGVLALAAALLPGLDAAAQQLPGQEPPLPSSSAPLLPKATCPEARVDLAPVSGGRTRISVDSPCRAHELVIFNYAGVIFMRWLDALGHTDFILDCFAGDREAIALSFEDKTTAYRQPVVGGDMRDLTKVAIVWTSKVDLDLHAFEYAAAFDSPGHVWARRPRSFEEAASVGDGRGHGFLSTVGGGDELGMNVEVYTFVHQRGQTSGIVKLAVDYVSRGSRPEGRFCGGGDLAEVRFKAYILERDRPLRILDLAFGAAPCGVEINAGAKLNQRLIPDIVIRK